MDNNIILKPATMDDADMLLKWRNDPETRKASRNNDYTSKHEHWIWLDRAINSLTRNLYVAWIGDTRVGTVRIDQDIAYFTYELFWTVAPEFRRLKIGKQIVSLILKQFPHELNIKAIIKSNNLASIRIAEYAGMKFRFRDSKGFFTLF